jgi:signal transduction histidine kinase
MVQRLETIIPEKFDEMDRTVALKRARRDAEAMAIVRTNRGKALMDEADVFFAGIIRAADDRLTAGVAEQTTNAGWLRTFSIIGALFIVAVVGGATASIVRYTIELRQARDEVGILNAELEQRVTERTSELARANDEIQRFAYIVTHDLRAPLVNIMGFTAEIESGVEHLQAFIEQAAIEEPVDPIAKNALMALTEEIPEAIRFVRSSAKRMDSLINAILKLSREGRRTLRPEQVDLSDVIESSVASVQHRVLEANGEVHIEGDLPSVLNDRLSLEQIFGNLLDNAVKYRSRTRPLRIEVRIRAIANGWLEIEVIDNGRGIAEHDLEKVFELFRRAGEQDLPGEGIGLAYVRTVVRNLGGRISVTSEVNEGTTFRVVLPRDLGAQGLTA